MTLETKVRFAALVVLLVAVLVVAVESRSSAPAPSRHGNLVTVSPTSTSIVPETSTTSTTSSTLPVTPPSRMVEEPEAPLEEVVAGPSLGRFEATCYALRGRTASGAPAGPGSIAVDPRIIPLGTVLEVEGYGRGVAVDTGGAIKGRRLDVWKSSVEACRAWGRRTVAVSVVG